MRYWEGEVTEEIPRVTGPVPQIWWPWQIEGWVDRMSGREEEMQGDGNTGLGL